MRFDIGSVSIAPALILAPMSGITDSVFRRIIRLENPNAIGLMVTELISVEALTRKNLRTVNMLNVLPDEQPLAVQIFGYDIERMVDAAIAVEQSGAVIVDINCGCPVPKVVRRGGGCELMRQPKHLDSMLNRIVKSVSIPVTIKIRSGWSDDKINAVEIAKIAEGAGACMITVHGRTRMQMYRGLADVGIVGQVASEVSIPVVGSGDVVDGETAVRYFNQGASGAMIGRAVIENPWVFTDVFCSLRGDAPQKRDRADISKFLLKYRLMLGEVYPLHTVLGRLKQVASKIIRAEHGSRHVRQQFCHTQSVEEFERLVCEWGVGNV